MKCAAVVHNRVAAASRLHVRFNLRTKLAGPTLIMPGLGAVAFMVQARDTAGALSMAGAHLFEGFKFTAQKRRTTGTS